MFTFFFKIAKRGKHKYIYKLRENSYIFKEETECYTYIYYIYIQTHTRSIFYTKSVLKFTYLFYIFTKINIVINSGYSSC
jgi:hypothetical protein